jgi:hypothetical protein
MVGGIWFCQRCIDAMAFPDAQPVVSTDNPDRLDALQQWLSGLRDLQQGNEPAQRDVPISPLPPYDYASVPGEWSTPGTSLPERTQRSRDPESVPADHSQRNVNVPEPRELEPVSYSPTGTRPRPFLPTRQEPEHSPTPLQPGAEIVQDPVHIPVHVPPQQTFPEPPAKKIRTTRLPEPEQAPQKFTEKFTPREISPEISEPKREGKPQSKPEHAGQPATPLQPKFTTKLYGKQKRPGRQRGKDRNDSNDGVRQLFELWWSKAGRGVRFGQFYRGHLSESMRTYYPREYINGANPKSAAEYRQWRKEWTANRTAKTA